MTMGIVDAADVDSLSLHSGCDYAAHASQYSLHFIRTVAHIQGLISSPSSGALLWPEEPVRFGKTTLPLHFDSASTAKVTKFHAKWSLSLAVSDVAITQILEGFQ